MESQNLALVIFSQLMPKILCRPPTYSRFSNIEAEKLCFKEEAITLKKKEKENNVKLKKIEILNQNKLNDIKLKYEKK